MASYPLEKAMERISYPGARPATVQASIALLALYGLLTLAGMWYTPGSSVEPLALVVSALALLFAVAMWRRQRWGWLGAFALMLVTMGRQVIAIGLLLQASGGAALLVEIARIPLVLAATLTELLLLVMLMLPSTKAWFHRAAA